MQQRKFKKKYIITAISTAMLSQLAAAQTDSQAATDEEAQGPVFEEVVVTATRREQTVQEIPFNISAVSGDDIDEAGYVSAAELFRGVPGVSLADGGARNADTNNTITIRGINLDPNATDRLFLTDPTVSTYINNTPTYSNFILKDIARVEVLRGPQSTLYGSGSLGGTVRYILNEPETDFFYGSVTANLSQTDGSDGLNKALDAVLNIPLADTMALRLSAGLIDDPGVIDYVNVYATGADDVPLAEGGDIVNGLPIIVNEKDADTAEVDYLRAAFLFAPNDSFKSILTYQQQSGDFGGRRQQTSSVNGLGEEYDDYEIGSVILEPASNDTQSTSLEIDVDLGFATVSSSSSYYTSERESVSENTGFYAALDFLQFYGTNPRKVLAAYRENEEKAFVQELRLASNDGLYVDWVVGGYYQDQKQEAFQDTTARGTLAWADAAGQSALFLSEKAFLWGYEREFTDYAVFGEATFHLNDSLDLTLGMRHFDNEDKVTSQTAVPTIPQYPDKVTSQIANSDELFKMNLAWYIDEASTLYATVSEGYRKGGVNAIITYDENIPLASNEFANDPALSSFDADTVVNYEIGYKGQTASLIYNAALYYVDWKNPQVNIDTDAGSFYAVTNADEAVSQGLELSFDWLIDDAWRFSGGYAYTDAKLTKDYFEYAGYTAGQLVADPSLVDNFGKKVDFIAEKGDRLPGTAEHSLNLTLAYSYYFSNGYELVNRLDYYYQSDVENYIEQNSTRSAKLDPFSVWYVSSILMMDQWTTTFYIQNVLNEEGITATFPDSYMTSDSSQGYNGTGQKDFIINPRTIGVELTYSFE